MVIQIDCYDIKKNTPDSTVIQLSLPIRVYDVIVSLASVKQITISSVFIYTSPESEKHIDSSTSWEIDTYPLKLYYNIIQNRCASCYKRAAPIIGDCSFCLSKYCAIHRLPESHSCACINQCKQQLYEKNRDILMSQKCVASQITNY